MDLYTPGHSLAHRLHPGAKILCFVLLCIAPVVLNDIQSLAVVCLASLFLGAMTGALRAIGRFAPILLLFFILTVCIWALLRPVGVPIFEWHHLRASRESVAYGVAMGLRLVGLTVIGLTFLTATSVEDFSLGCQSLGMGYRASFALSLSFRLIPLFFSTIDTVVLAQKSRGLDLSRKGPIGRLRSYVPLFVPIISHALRDADGLAMALECKGFGMGPRTSLDDRRWLAKDVAAVVVSVGILTMAVWARVR